MAQFARPSSDISDGSWSNQAASQTDMYQAIDEVSADDADYIRSASVTGTETCIIGLSGLSDPASSTGHVVRWRAQVANRVDDTIAFSIFLRQGAATTIATCRTGTITDATWTDGSYTLSGPEADAITNYSDLRLVFVKANSGDDAGINVQVSWAEMEVPDPSSTPIAAISGAQHRRRR